MHEKTRRPVINVCFNHCSLYSLYHSIIMASKHHDDWQSSKKTVLQRNAYMFDNELMSDVSFTCGESRRCRRIFHAHKYVLGTSSAVFYAMFYGDLAEKESTICLTDAEEESFEEFLRFLYTDDCKITPENAIGILYLAKKYLVSSLAKKSCEILEASIRPENVFAVLEQAIQFDEKKMEAKSWNIISKETQECLNSEAFCDIGLHTLNALLKKESLAVTKMELFKAVLKWTDSECARQGISIEEDKTARRRVLGDSVYEIGFLEMSQENIVKYVSPTEILTDTEVLCILKKMNGLDVADLKWKAKKCQRVPLVSLKRFDSGNVKPPGINWSYSGKADALTLTVNKAVLFHGVRLFGSTGESRYTIDFKIKDVTVTGPYTSHQDGDRVPRYDVMLPRPISLHPDEEVTITATVKGPSSYYGEHGKSPVKINGIVVTFKDAPTGASGNGTRKDRGQFYEILLSEL